MHIIASSDVGGGCVDHILRLSTLSFGLFLLGERRGVVRAGDHDADLLGDAQHDARTVLRWDTSRREVVPHGVTLLGARDTRSMERQKLADELVRGLDLVVALAGGQLACCSGTNARHSGQVLGQGHAEKISERVVLHLRAVGIETFHNKLIHNIDYTLYQKLNINFFIK